MEYNITRLDNQLDFTHPYLTIKQMEKLIKRNYEKPRDFSVYGYNSKYMISDLHNQLKLAKLDNIENSELRMPILVFPLPVDEPWKPVLYGFIVKYDANGETYLHTPSEYKL